MFVSLLAYRYGRRGVIWLGALLTCISGELQGAAQIVAVMIAGRNVPDFGTGLFSSTVLEFRLEIAPRILHRTLDGT